MHFHEYNAAEIVRGVRVDFDPVAGRPRKVTYRIDREAVQAVEQTKRSFTRDESTEGAQSGNRAYAGSGMDKGHLVQREAMKGDIATERAVDHWTTVVPMSPELNRGAGSPWRASERAAVNLARQNGSVVVEVQPSYEVNPPRLSDGTPIPKEITRTIKTLDGRVLQSQTFVNYD
jgi:DNA/RNA endonuclease G (NUC1)